MISRSIIPIIVGGTNYYIESLLWKVLVNPPIITDDPLQTEDSTNDKIYDDVDGDGQSCSKKGKFEMRDIPKMTVKEMEEMQSEVLHKYLMKVDSVSAERLHPNNKRKIIR